MQRLFLIPVLLVGIALAGCADFESYGLEQTGDHTVRATVTACERQSTNTNTTTTITLERGSSTTPAPATPQCGESGESNWTTLTVIAFDVPAGTTGPAKVTSTGTSAIAFERFDPAEYNDTSGQTMVTDQRFPARDGREWLYYRGEVAADDEVAEKLTGAFDFALPQAVTGTVTIPAAISVWVPGCPTIADCISDEETASVTLKTKPVEETKTTTTTTTQPAAAPAAAAPAAAPAPVTTTAPSTSTGKVTIKKLSVSKNGTITADFANGNGYAVAIRASLTDAKKRGLGTATAKMAANGSATGTLRLNARGRALLAKGPFWATAKLKVRDAKRTLTTSTTRIRISR